MFMTLVSAIFRIINFIQYYEYALSMDGKWRGQRGDGTKEGTGRNLMGKGEGVAGREDGKG